MKITLIDAGKRFNRDWVFRHLSYEFSINHSYAITGPNGSGKSTLLQSIAGAIAISEGDIRYERIGSAAAIGAQATAGNPKARLGSVTSGASAPSPGDPIPRNPIPADQVYRHLSL